MPEQNLKLPSRSFKENLSINLDNFKIGLRDFAYNNLFGEYTGLGPALRHFVYNDPNTSAEEALIAMVVPGEGVAAKVASTSIDDLARLSRPEAEKIFQALQKELSLAMSKLDTFGPSNDKVIKSINYINELIRKLTEAGHDFFSKPKKSKPVASKPKVSTQNPVSTLPVKLSLPKRNYVKETPLRKRPREYWKAPYEMEEFLQMPVSENWYWGASEGPVFRKDGGVMNYLNYIK